MKSLCLAVAFLLSVNASAVLPEWAVSPEYVRQKEQLQKQLKKVQADFWKIGRLYRGDEQRKKEEFRKNLNIQHYLEDELRRLKEPEDSFGLEEMANSLKERYGVREDQFDENIASKLAVPYINELRLIDPERGEKAADLWGIMQEYSGFGESLAAERREGLQNLKRIIKEYGTDAH